MLAIVAIAAADSYGSSYKPATYSAPAYKQEYSVSLRMNNSDNLNEF